MLRPAGELLSHKASASSSPREREDVPQWLGHRHLAMEKRHLGSRRLAHTCNNAPGAGSIGGHAQQCCCWWAACLLAFLLAAPHAPITVASRGCRYVVPETTPPATYDQPPHQGWLWYHTRAFGWRCPTWTPHQESEREKRDMLTLTCSVAREASARARAGTASMPSRRSYGCGVRFRGPRWDRSDLQRPCAGRTGQTVRRAV